MSRAVNLHFPVGGLSRRTGLQTQAPYTTPDCNNVRSADTAEGRERGGSRPGLAKYIQTVFGSAGKYEIRMMGEIQAGTASSVLQWIDDISIASWSNAGWDDLYGTGADQDGNRRTSSWAGRLWYCDDEDGESLWAFKDFSATTLTDEMWIEAQISSNRLPWAGAVSLCLDVGSLDDVKAVGSYDRLIATFTKEDDEPYLCDITLAYHIAGVSQVLAGYSAATNQTIGRHPRMRLWVSNTSCKVYLDDVQVISCTLPGAMTNRGIGLIINPSDDLDIGIENLTYQYNELARVATTSKLCVSAGGTLATVDDSEIAPWEYSGNVTLSWQNRIRCAPLLGKLYIADYSTGRVTAQAVDTIDTTGAPFTRNRMSETSPNFDWDAVGDPTVDTAIDKYADVAVCYNGIDDTAPITNYTATASGPPWYLILTRDLQGAGTSCTARIERGVKVYDPADDTLTILDSAVTASPPARKGQVPAGCPLICTFSGRLFLAGQETAPHVWYACRQGDPTDWDYSDTDVQAACAGVASQSDTGTETGKIFDAITCLAPFSNDYLIIGCRNSLWVMRGDPGSGGVIDLLSSTVGVVSGDAWAMMPDGSFLFLSVNGLYYVAPGAGSFPQAFSTEIMPRELLGLDPNNYDVLMGYDPRFEGVHVYITPKSGGAHRHWWIDWKTKSFWPATLQLDHHPTSLFLRANGELILGCRDGYIRAYSLNATTDDGEEIDSYVVYGPFKLGRGLNQEGLSQELVGVLDSDSGDVDWSLHVGDTADAALDAGARETGTWPGGRSVSAHPRARGLWGILKLTSTSPWQIEAAELTLRDGGKWRHE